jgi:hypothetical protein
MGMGMGMGRGRGRVAFCPPLQISILLPVLVAWHELHLPHLLPNNNQKRLPLLAKHPRRSRRKKERVKKARKNKTAAVAAERIRMAARRRCI